MSRPHRALVTAPFRGVGLETLRGIADVVLDPWIDHTPLRLLDGEKLAALIQEVDADLLIVESDFVTDPVYDLPLVAEDYIHRVGRTGRAGHNGRAVSLVSSAELELLRDIQRLLPAPLEQVAVEGFDATHAGPSIQEPSRTGGWSRDSRFVGSQRITERTARHSRSKKTRAVFSR